MGNAIMIWSGALASIPSGWLLCDGTNGTPALDVKYIRGAYSAGTRPSGTDVGTVGHTHTLGNSTDDAHTHATGSDGGHSHAAAGSGSDLYLGLREPTLALSLNDGAHAHTTPSGTTSAHTHTQNSSATYSPPYYMLGYIMYSVAEIMPDLPIDGIAMWTGSEADVPTDWAYCDGTGDTPDLRDKFLYGYKAGTNAVGDTGGAASHTHALTNAGTHTHTATVSNGGTSHSHAPATATGTPTLFDYDAGPNDDALAATDATHTHSTLGTAGNHAHTVTTETFLERYYTLAYLIKTA